MSIVRPILIYIHHLLFYIQYFVKDREMEGKMQGVLGFLKQQESAFEVEVKKTSSSSHEIEALKASLNAMIKQVY